MDEELLTVIKHLTVTDTGLSNFYYDKALDVTLVPYAVLTWNSSSQTRDTVNKFESLDITLTIYADSRESIMSIVNSITYNFDDSENYFNDNISGWTLDIINRTLLRSYSNEDYYQCIIGYNLKLTKN